MSEDVELDHRKDWEGRVESWAQATEINAISREAEEARSTLGLIARSLRKVDKIPQFPLAKATNVQGSVHTLARRDLRAELHTVQVPQQVGHMSMAQLQGGGYHTLPL